MLSRCIEEADKIPKTHGRHRLFSIVTDKRGRVLGQGHNDYNKTSPVQKKYGSKFTSEDAQYLHSECRAIIKSKGKGYRIYVGRVTNSGKQGLAKPCLSCMAIIQNETDIKEVIYSISDNEHGIIKIVR